jgi:hypothetical protein
MSAGREEGKGSGSAVSRNIEIALSVCHEGKSRNIALRIPDQIKLDNLWLQAKGELGLDLALGKAWRIWQGDVQVQPPYQDGQEYGMVPDDLTQEVILRQPPCWSQLQGTRDLPDLSQFRVIANDVDVTTIDKWPAGNFGVMLVNFAVDFEIENPMGGRSQVGSNA